MKFSKKYCIGLMLCIVLAASPIESELMDSDTEINVINAGLPALTGLCAMLVTAVPAGPILVSALGLLHVASMIITGSGGDDEGASKALTNMDLLKVQTHMSEEIRSVGKSVIDNIKQAVRDLTHVIEASGFSETFRNTLEYLRRTFADKIKVVLDRKVTGLQKNTTMNSLLDYESKIRETVRSFITTFIKPSILLPTSGPIKLFYEFLLEKHHLLALEDDDFDSESLHSKIFKSYLYVVKTLSDIYVLIISAHVIQFQEEMQQARLSDAAATRDITKGLIQDYKNDMKALMDKTKWALDNASREIRNSGVFVVKKGETIERLSFAKIVPRIMYIGNEGGCQEDKGAVNIMDYETGNCDSFPGVMPANSDLAIYENPTADPDSPYQFMTMKSPGGEDQIFGHNSSDPNLIVQEVKTHAQCYTVFCTAYKKNVAGISTQRVRAQHGNVITGMRFRVSNNILYIDIQEGKFIDPVTVDPNTVKFTETPESTQVQYLSSKINKLELGDFELKDNSFLTVIQMKLTNQREGIVRVFIDGSTAPNWYTFGPYESSQSFSELKELDIYGGDDPAVADTKCKIANRGVPSYFIRFGTTGFQQDFGRTSVPLIDIREVVSDPPAPLKGFGIYICGVVVSVNLVTADLSPLVDYKPIEQFTEPIMKV